MKKSLFTFLLLAGLALGIVLTMSPAIAQLDLPQDDDTPSLALDPVTGEIIRGGPDIPAASLPGTSGLTLGSMPVKSDPARVAVLFHRLTGQLPPFAEWAKQTPEFKQASDFERSTVLEVQTSAMKDLYRLTTLSEPIVVDLAVRVSEYSFSNKGFLLGNLTDDVIFPFSYAGRNYAVTVPGLQEAEWLPVEDDKTAMTLDVAAAKNDRLLHAVLVLSAVSADRKGTIKINGVDYWMLAGRLQEMQFYEPGKTRLLHEVNYRISQKEEDNSVMNELNQLKNN